MSTERPIRVASIEDDAGLRETYRLLVSRAQGFVFAEDAPSVEIALHTFDFSRLDVLLLDIRLPGEQGTTAIPKLLERNAGLLVLMLTAFEDDERLFEALRNGASGYLLKRTPPAALLEAVRDVFQGGAPMSPEIARKVIRQFHGVPAGPAVTLSLQETRCLELLSKGASYQSAGEALEVSVNTVRNYVRAVYEKLHVHTKAEAVTKALKAGLIH